MILLTKLALREHDFANTCPHIIKALSAAKKKN